MKQSATLARLSKKTVAFLAAATTLLAGLSLATAAPQQANAATRDSYADTIGNPTFEAARQKYGLPKDMKDGATLHAFEWSFKTIMENIPDIAKAGYTSIQTEPIVKIKDNRKLGTGNWYLNWYYVYQPTDMSIGNYVVGSEDEFKEMCKLAHQYGLRIIVDSVSNHFTSDFDVIEGKWKNKAYYHEDKQISDYNNREDCTQHKLSGLWDLNTQDDTVTKGMHDLLVQTVADGADGFRYDAAKHIELSDEVFGGKQSHYWDTILQNGAQYQYGEVLEDANVREADYANLFNSSSPRGGGITDSSYGHEVRNAVQFKNLGASHFTSHSKVTEDKSVNWVESHDNFANGEANIPQELSDEWIKYGWAGVTAQKNGMSLFFDRPYKDGGTYGTGGVGTYGNGSGPFTENSKLGDAGSDLWKDPEVVAVNHFRNAMVGEASNVSNCGDDNCLMVERYAGSAAQDGMVVANANGSDKNLAGQSTKLANGTYTDEVTGSTITVSGGKVISGTVKGQSIAAFSNKTRSGKVSTAEAYPNKGTIPGESKTITLRSYQSTNTTYSTSDGQSGSFKDGDTIEIGSKAKSDEVVTVTVKGTGADGETIKHTYSYTKYGDPTYDPSDGTSSPCDKYCMEYMEKNGLDPDCYIDAKEPCHPRNVTVTAIKVSGDTSMDLASTQSVQLKADVTTDPAGKRPSVTWTSSDTSVATVDSKGKVSGLKAGTVKITATAGTNKKSDSITITITGVKPEVSNVIYATKPSGWNKIYAYVYNDTTSKNNGNWPGVEMTQLTADDSCAKAGAYKYEVPDLGEGKYRVIFTNGSGAQTPGASQPGIEFSGKVSWDGSSAAVSAVNCNTPQPVPVSSVSISGSGVSDGKLSLKLGASVQLTATVTPSNATDKTVSWTSSNSSVAKVSDGKITAVKAGTATITATAGGKTASVVVAVADNPVPVESVSVSGDGVSDGKLSLKSGASAQLTATVKPDNATDRKVTWTSSDSSVANVMGTGVVTAGSKAGKATVTATAGGKSASVEVTVEAQDPYAELDALAKAHASDLEDGTYTVSTALKDGMVLDVADGSAKDGANARLWSSNGTKAQRWTVSHDSKGYVTLRNVNSGKALDVKDGKAANGSNVQQYAPNSYRSQKWVAVRSGSVYKLVSALSPSMALDVKDGKAANGSNVQIYTANGYRSQQWTFGTVGQSLKSATVWYRPSSTQSRVRVQWRVYGSPDTTGGVEMTQACGGWWKATVPSAGSTKVGLSFSYGSTTDDNGGKLYDVKGESAAVSGGQAVTDVTPNCAVTNK
ncbi:MAG: Ig-like domain-containing protein [Bifidobacterium adolescentis]|uniref:Ig-like domain-containing protein n=2 Tax=Bifidobacterium adolescentis TaxID=1680 RepID=UPI001E2E02FD|nr:Ig-like domain-containing protein [Bifidobacterium adolescentis]MDB1437673.1 Ig-like domain-containing protein [Bifidobacterium adolescentis]MDB1439494.1 Ig-like domain-containing protein [Bifidobacterium adolescentis]MDB1441315.1 Ig-like domain-containing protein [Bifidobacterium adolescentis]MDB1443191.1 Ig-like domain-containing protein [Bifidobacterium adolescentis]MDB1445065.1 Ig-like domain-containing protein [Bifidobacterium adolescentis]